MSIDEKEPTSTSMDSIFSGKKFDYHHLFHLVLDHSNDLILLLDKKRRILAINQRSAKLLGGLPRDFEGKYLSDALKDEHAEERNQDLRNMFRTGEKIIYNRQLEFGGEKIWLETAIEPIKDSSGEVQVALILAKDITEQKKAEEALSETKAYYQALFHNAQEAIFLINDDLRIIDANPAACKITSYNRQELLTSKILDLFVSQDAPLRQKFAALVSETRPYREGNPIKTKDGSIIELDFYIIGNIQPGQHLIVGRDVTEKKKIERALFESEESYRMLFETAGDAIFLMENDTFISCNQATVQMFGCRDESEILDHTPWDFSPKTQPDGRNSKEKGLEIIRSVIGGEPKSFYWKHLKKEGTPFDVEVTLNAFLLRGKTFIQAVLRDITDRMQAEKELRESEARYSSLVNVSPNSIFIVQDGNYVFANPAGAKMLGYNNPQDVIGLSTIKAMTEKSKQEVFEREKRALQGKKNALTLLEIQQPDGSIRQVESISIPYRFRDRPAALAIGIDVTDRVAQESMLSNFFKVAPLGVGVMVDNKFIQFNDRFCQMVGYTPEELANKKARMLYFSDEEYESVGQQKNRQIKETGIGVVETRFKRKDGSSLEVLLSSIPLDPNNPGKGLNITALDISDRKRAEQMLKNLNEELEERVRLRTQQLENKTVELESFSYSISHDLRAPLRAIHGFSQILLEEYATNWGEEPRELLENINAASQKMDQLIDGLLMLSRLGQKDILLVPTDICKIAEQVFANLSTQIPDREIEFQTSPCPKVWVDQQIIETALTNLIANAVKFTRPRAKALIEFGVEKRDETPVFYVRDNGVGFDQKYAEKLFSPFQRLESEGDFEGTGIGLSIVKRIVERHDGEIWVDAEEGRGATFYFTLNADPSVSLPENYVD